jgi:hypothetical protein
LILFQSGYFLKSIWTFQEKIFLMILCIILVNINWHSKNEVMQSQDKKVLSSKDNHKNPTSNIGLQEKSKSQVKDIKENSIIKEDPNLQAVKELEKQNLMKEEQEKINAARSESLRAAQIRQEQQAAEDRQRQYQQEQAEQTRIQNSRLKWASRCNLDRTNALEQKKIIYKNECDNTYSNAANTPINRLGVVACALTINQKAEEYAKVVFEACMSGAP